MRMLTAVHVTMSKEMSKKEEERGRVLYAFKNGFTVLYKMYLMKLK